MGKPTLVTWMSDQTFLPLKTLRRLNRMIIALISLSTVNQWHFNIISWSTQGLFNSGQMGCTTLRGVCHGTVQIDHSFNFRSTTNRSINYNRRTLNQCYSIDVILLSGTEMLLGRERHHLRHPLVLCYGAIQGQRKKMSNCCWILESDSRLALGFCIDEQTMGIPRILKSK